MKLSVVTICYNDLAGFRKTAKSVTAQTCKEFEWIIIDGASTDGSAEFIKEKVDELQSKTETAGLVRYWCSEPDKGIYNAMNKGIHQASGEYLIFMNSGDCLYSVNTISNVLPLLKDKDVYVGDIVNDCDGKMQVIEFPRRLTPQILLDQIIFCLIPHQASFIRRDLFERYGLYREDLRIASDWFFFYETLVMRGATIASIPTTIAIFDMTGISSTDSRRTDERITSQASMPCQQHLYCFYRDNAEIVDAQKATYIGRTLMRTYFFFYRKLRKLRRKRE